MNRPVSCCAHILAMSLLVASPARAVDRPVPPNLEPLVVKTEPTGALMAGRFTKNDDALDQSKREDASDLRAIVERLAPLESAPPDSASAPGDVGAPRGGTSTGACCFGEPTCVIASEAACVDEGLRWLGADTTCDLCPVLPSCSGDSLYAQSPGNPFEFGGGGTSEASQGLQRFEQFSDIAGPITRVNFYGFDLALTPGGAFIECDEFDNTFQVSFHPDVGDRPSDATFDFTLTATRTPTGIYYINGFELHTYEVELPEPVLMERGWISIVGLGDPTCLFVWSSPPGNVGDDFSVCLGCTDSVQGLDLAMCLRGTFGGVTGACCDASDGTCTDNVQIYQCNGPTEQFTPNATCAELTPACGIPTGACCSEDITRGVGTCVNGLTEGECDSFGDRFEPNSVCQFLQPACGESTGACCIGSISCLITTQAICADEGWTWLGSDTVCADCPTLPPCPTGTLFGQPPLDIGLEPSLYTSEESPGFTIFDDFQGVGGTITDIQFYGVDLMPVGPSTFIECEETILDFEIKFYEDEGGAPGPVVSSQFVTAVRTPTGVVYRGAEYNLYQAELIEPVAMTRGWISIVGAGSPTCYFLWAPSADVAGGSVRSIPNFVRPIRQNESFAFCLIGDEGGATGACCNQVTGVCTDGVAIQNCVGPNDRFMAGGTCAIDLADCGIPKGACCLSGLDCLFITSADCGLLGGDFLGVDTACLQCPCNVICEPGSINEGEPVCSPTFEDVTNYGCAGETPRFTSMVPNERYCGRTGITFAGESIIFDYDWYELVLTEATNVAYRLETEAPANIRVYDGSQGCPGFLLGQDGATSCTATEIFFFLEPGTYWIQIEPVGPSGASACGATYQLSPLNVPCDADFDFDRDVDMIDFGFFQPQFGMNGAGLFGDLNGDEVVDIADVHLFESELGTTCP